MSTAGDLTFDEVREALVQAEGADVVAQIPDEEIESLRQTANVMTELLCATYQRQRVKE